jgi:hypothetical protein
MNRKLLARALRAAVCLLAISLPRGAQAGELWRIGEDGSDSARLSEALECAADGDVLSFTRGVHEVDTVLGQRTLTLVGERGARLRGHLTITGEDPNASVRLVGLRLEALPWSGSAALTVRDFAGRVWLQDCELLGGDPYDAPYPPLATAGEALRIVNAAEVVLVACALDGGPAAPTAPDSPPPAAGPAALHCVASRIALFDCVLRGGDGAADDHGLSAWAGEGGPALFQRSGSRSFLWQTRLSGGDGGLGSLGMDGLGGTGLHTEGWSVETHAVRVDGGSGSSRGLGIYQAGGRLREEHAWLRELVVTNPNRDDGMLTVLARGVPGESVVLELSRDSIWPESGVRPDSIAPMLGRVSHEVPLGLVPPSGMILRRFDVGSLPPGKAATVFAQLRHETQSGEVRGPAALLVMVDAAR